MYVTHFNLQQKPFNNTPDSQFFFKGGKRGEVLDAIVFAIESGEAIVKIVGEVGSGKTMLCRMLPHRLSKNIDLVYLLNPNLKPTEIITAICNDINLDISHCQSEVERLTLLRNYLLKQHETNKKVVILIEEAQAMSAEALEEIRLLTNLETEQEKLLQIVLLGQPELDARLANTQLRQLNERISYQFILKPFTFDEVRNYLSHRLQCAGFRGADLFCRKAAQKIARAAGGSIRKLNTMADRALLAAYVNQAHYVSLIDTVAAIKDTGFAMKTRLTPNIFYALCVGFILLLAMAGFSYLQKINVAAADTGNTLVEISQIEAQLPVINQTPIAGESIEKITIADTDSIINKRMEATINWADSIDGKRYTVQLMTSYAQQLDELVELKKFLSLDDTEEFSNQFYVFHGTMKQSPVYILSFHDFPTVREAKKAIEKLPKELLKYSPYIRTLDSLREEIGLLRNNWQNNIAKVEL